MTVLEALMAAGLFVAPVGDVKWPEGMDCGISVKPGETLSCDKLGGTLVPNVYDPTAQSVPTSKEPPVETKIPGDIAGGPLPSELRRFNDELATIPGAFDGAMKEDKPDLKDLAVPLPRPKPLTTEGKAD